MNDKEYNSDPAPRYVLGARYAKVRSLSWLPLQGNRIQAGSRYLLP